MYVCETRPQKTSRNADRTGMTSPLRLSAVSCADIQSPAWTEWSPYLTPRSERSVTRREKCLASSSATLAHYQVFTNGGPSDRQIRPCRKGKNEGSHLSLYATRENRAASLVVSTYIHVKLTRQPVPIDLRDRKSGNHIPRQIDCPLLNVRERMQHERPTLLTPSVTSFAHPSWSANSSLSFLSWGCIDANDACGPASFVLGHERFVRRERTEESEGIPSA